MCYVTFVFRSKLFTSGCIILGCVTAIFVLFLTVILQSHIYSDSFISYQIYRFSMSRKMNVNRLSKLELEYELTVRGIGIGTVEQMRSSLSVALRMEREGDGVLKPPHPYSFDEDVAAVQDKIAELSASVASFGGDSRSTEYLKLETKFSHLLGRVERIVADEKDVKTKDTRSELMGQVFALLGNFEEKVKSFRRKRSCSTPIGLEILEGGHKDPEPEGEPDAFDLPEHLSMSHGQSASCSFIKPLPVAKWNLKFSGDKRSMSVNSFLEQVDELCVARRVSKAELFKQAFDLFSGKALIWYRATRKQVHSWDELVECLREEFQPIDYDEKLLDEIKRRTQGKDETIGIYLSVMSSLFGRLACPVSETARLKILLRNISPFYQSQLGLVEVNSIDDLRTYCRKLEARRESVEAFTFPSRHSSTLEPDLAYVDVDDSVVAIENAAAGLQLEGSSSKCFNCGMSGHMAKGCLAPKRKYCYRCKKEGFTVVTCPNCSRSGNGNRRS